MFTKNELETTKRVAERKIDEILNDDKEFTVDSLRDLQTLAKLKDAAEKKEGI